MAERVARVAQEYAGRHILPGEKFHVEPQHERLLEAIGRIEALAAQAEPISARRDMQASKPATYQTRDMAAAQPKKRRNRKSILGRGAAT